MKVLTKTDDAITEVQVKECLKGTDFSLAKFSKVAKDKGKDKKKS